MTTAHTISTHWTSFDIEAPPEACNTTLAFAAVLRMASVVAVTDVVTCVLVGNGGRTVAVDCATKSWEELELRAQRALSQGAPTEDLDPNTAHLVFSSTPTAAPVGLEPRGHRETVLVAHASEPGSGRATLRVSARADAPFSGSLPGMLRLALQQAAAGVGAPPQASLLSDEQAALLLDWNCTTTEVDSRTPVEHVEQRARTSPDKIAVDDGTESLTYATLARRAAVVAGVLRRHGVARGDRVGLYMQRSVDLLVCLLGVMKSGAAYVPLDPSFPSDRLDFMVEDAGIEVLLTEQSLLKSTPGRCATALVVDGDEMTSSEPWHGTGCTEASTAYVLYTSGSTGQPKGVEVPHRALSNFLGSMAHEPGLREDDVLLAATSLSFDIAGLELYLPLVVGAKVIITPSDVAADGHALSGHLEATRPTVFQATPSGYRLLLAAGWRGDPQIRLLCGGEPLAPALIELLLPRCSALWNLYGPTETTIWSSAQHVVSAAAPVSIGRPIANTTLHVLDARGFAVPIGVPGELHIGGSGLAIGYFGRDDLTRHAFVEMDGRRLYRTGDIARLRADGTYEHLGRTDQQVKVRGFRIELGEVEAALQKFPAVEGAVAVVDARSEGGRLLAYVASTDPNINMYEVRNRLARTLPAYMIPTAFVFLEQLPLTPNGKVDRKALPAIDKVYVDDSVDFAAPTTAHEATLTRVWSEVLGLDTVGIDDNYFALGGDSIRSVSIITRMREEGLESSVGQLFDTPTIRTLAETVQPIEPQLQHADEPFALISDDDRAQLPEGLDDALPLTSLQVGMLHVMASHPEVPLYVNTFGSMVHGPFDAAAFERVLAAIVQRHPALRSSIDLGSNSVPLQLVHSEAKPHLTIDDLRGVSAPEQRRAIEGWMETERERAFDIRQAPLVRFHIAWLSESTFSLLHTTHHALFDGWSTSSMVAEIVKRYDAELAGKTSADVTPLIGPLRARAAAEAEARTSDTAAAFWKDAMADYSHVPLPEPWRTQSWEQHRKVVELPASVVRRLRVLAERTQTSMQAVILAGHVAVMAFVTGQDDVVTGVSVPGRPEVQASEQALGLFLSTAPLRESARAQSWRSLVERAHATQRSVGRHGLYPLARIRAGGGGTFESLINFMDFHVFDSARNLSRARLLDSESGAVDAQQSFAMTEVPLEVDVCLEDVAGKASLNLLAHHLEPDVLARIGGYYQRALAAMAADPEQSPQAAELLSDEERQQLTEFATNDDDAVPPLDRPPHMWVQHWARETPSAIAVRDEFGSCSYSELHERVRALAEMLKARGVREGDRVGVLHPRTTDLLASLLAVHTIGAAYVPLDPSHPAQRLAFVFGDAEIDTVLTRSELCSLLPEHVRPICLDQETTPSVDHGPDPVVSADHVAYLLYTSGSSGQPKGAIVTHGCLANLVASMQRTPGMFREDVGMCVVSVAFDISAGDLFVPMSVGAQVVLASSAAVADGFALAELIDQARPTVMHATPSACRMLLAAGWSGSPSLRLCCGGETLPPSLAQTLLERVEELWNGYGPTECTVYTTFHRVTDTRVPAIPIGRPISGATVHVLDPHGRALPVGVAGELLIGGAGVANGYHARPDLTQSKFITRPDDTRVYRSGDSVRFLADGTLDHRARIDDQVKVRGYRIELGEIERALERVPSVRAAVVAFDSGSGGDRLTGYVVGDGVSTQGLGNVLAQTLPAYMIPSVFMVLDELPLTPNGKIDRAALPAPEPAREQMKSEITAPRTSTERTLASIWKDVLGVEQVGIDDDFFALGGDSIHSVHILAKAKTQGIVIATTALFDTPTIRELVEDLNL